MGQEAGKPAWPKPAGGYQTITGRRYGRRHAYVSFRPTPAAKHRSTADWPERERNPVRKERPLAPKGKISTMFRAMLPGSANSVHPEPTAKAGEAEAPGKKQQPSSRRPAETPSAQHKKPRSRRAGAGGDQRRARSADRKSAEASAWPVLDEEDASLVKARVLSFVNIDSDEPDSSGGDEEEEEEEEEGEEEEEEENPGSDPSQGLQRRLDSMIFELGKEFDYLSGLHSYLYTKSCDGAEHPVKDSTARDLTDPSNSKGAAPHRGSPEGQTGSDQTLTSPGTPGDFAAGVSPAYSMGPGHGADQTGPPTSQTEMVVRPKIRKQTSETHLEKRKSSQHHHPHHGEEEGGQGGVSVAPPASAGGKAKCVSAPPFFLTQTERPDHDLLFSFPPADRGGLSPGERRRRGEEGAENGGKISSDDDEDDIWEDLEDFSEKAAPFLKAEESSEGSEGEWSASWVSDSGLEKQRGSSEESWETLGGPDDPRSLENSPGPSQPPGEPAALEEGEVRWLMYNEETVSSSDEDDPEGMSHFVHPGLFILDGNNNLEDDSSVSEDLDAEWRLLDDFGEGFGMAQAISYVDPQLLTYMALEERLAQAMEAALAHLESLAIDVEQAYPPATEQIIACLPQITVQDDPSGQEQCCAICCCEYIKDEIATQLPCHHMFHKICVTLWLQKSGTCPVCRHVLAPALPEAPAPTSFVSDQDIPPSNHSAAGTR